MSSEIRPLHNIHRARWAANASCPDGRHTGRCPHHGPTAPDLDSQTSQTKTSSSRPRQGPLGGRRNLRPVRSTRVFAHRPANKPGVMLHADRLCVAEWASARSIPVPCPGGRHHTYLHMAPRISEQARGSIMECPPSRQLAM